jgi:hypothetical protein
MEDINSRNVKFDTLEIPNQDGEPVEVYITGATVSQGEKRQPDTLGAGSGSFQSNDYFTSLPVVFSRPVKVHQSDKAGLIEISKKIAWVQEFANNNNRKSQQAHGLVPKVSRDLQNYVKVNQNNNFDLSKVIEAGNEPAWLMQELTSFSNPGTASVPANAVQNDDESTPKPVAKAPAKKQVRKPAAAAKPKPEVT